MTQTSDIAVLVVAAGSGARVGGPVPKQFAPLAGVPLLARTCASLLAADETVHLTIVIGKGQAGLYTSAITALPAASRARLTAPVTGGASRQASVHAGLEALALRQPPPSIVLIHDAARPFVSPALVARAISAARAHGCAVPALPVTDTVKAVSAEGVIGATVPRENLRLVQTPQAFGFALILAAHRKAALEGRADLTDDAAAAEWAGHAVHVFDGDRANMKVTEPGDFARAEAQLAAAAGDIRVGQGYDVHAFTPGKHVTLGGVTIPHTHGLSGHSDADVALHALTDAILGALGDGDIGAHFPPSDPQWKGAASHIFLRDAAARVAARGGIIAHLDVTLICEAPKIGPHREAMRAAIAGIAGVDIGRVGVKATTSEGLGFTGRREGIAAMASATVRLPFGG